jgi:hypothetical protein
VNERIKELAEQAGMVIIEDRFSTYLPFVEKFAELIVEECIDYCGENLSKTVGGALKIHFGVEE